MKGQVHTVILSMYRADRWKQCLAESSCFHRPAYQSHTAFPAGG